MSSSYQSAKLKLGRLVLVVVVAMLSAFGNSGCGPGRVGDAIEAVKELEPEIEKRNKEFEDLAKPGTGREIR